MKNLIYLVVVVFLVTQMGCSEDVEKRAKINVPYVDTGVDSNAWARIPAGKFYTNRYLHDGEIKKDYEMMVTHVTNQQFVDYLKKVVPAGTVKLKDNALYGHYATTDPFNNGRHEFHVKAGEKLHMKLGQPGIRVKSDGRTFSVQSGFQNHPVIFVTWFGAKTYCEDKGGRLPSEWEWTKAARGEDKRAYPWGDKIARNQANILSSRDPYEKIFGRSGGTTPVGYYNGKSYDGYQTMDARSPYGLYDMSGNVWHWLGDLYHGMHYRWMRGGSFDNYDYDVRIWSTNNAGPDYSEINVGFRCVRDVATEKVPTGNKS